METEALTQNRTPTLGRIPFPQSHTNKNIFFTEMPTLFCFHTQLKGNTTN